MSDFLLEISHNPRARKWVKTLGLPVPLPETLERAKGPWQDRPLADRAVAVGGGGKNGLLQALAPMLCRTGADAFVLGDASAFKEPGEAYGRPAQALELGNENQKYWALLFDASTLASPSELVALYEFFHPLVRAIKRSGRAIIVGRPPESTNTPEAAAAQAALEGFVRSLAKEVGKRGATADLVWVAPGAEARAEGVVRFLLAPQSAFVSGQPFRVTAQAKDAPKNGKNGSLTRPLDGKVVLLTGAARGIGEATVRLLAAEGAKVICLDRPEDDTLVSQVARDIGGTVLLADVSDPEAGRKIAAEVKERFGGLDVLVHNAGVTRDKMIANMKPEHWNQALDINLGAVVRITAELEGLLRPGGRVICLSSIAAVAGNAGQTNYSAGKAGIIGYVRSLADKLAARGITVNALAPGFIETRLTAAIPVVIREIGRRLSSVGQGGLPEDVGQVITFLATPWSQGLTGQVVRVCGGAFVGA